jgi:hypothetical protein
MDFHRLTDDDLNAMRRAPKKIINPSARWVTKGGHREKNFTLHSIDNAEETFRVFLRVSATRIHVFSVGLARTFPDDEVLVLARYNSGHHAHRNILERTKVPAVCHRHLATHRYISAGLDPDGYAEPIYDYNSVEGAFECLCRDCGIVATHENSLQAHLEF